MFRKTSFAFLVSTLTMGLAACEPEKFPSPVNPSEGTGAATQGSKDSATGAPTTEVPGEGLGFEVTSFDRCVAAGGPVMESMPRQCSHAGKHFVEDLKPGNKGEVRRLVYRIAAQDSECSGAQGPQRCLVANGELFYDAIDGFSFKPGVEVIVEVERTQHCDPEVLNDCPQDIGIYRYKLLRVISSKTDDANGGTDEQNAKFTTFQGTITKIEPGKDGYTVELTNADQGKLYAVLSIPNLGPDSGFDFGAIKVGTKIEVQGEVFMLGDKRQMAAKKARVLP